MQSLLNLHASSGLPLCLSGITNPLTLSKEMADHDLRREAMKKRRSKGRKVLHADQEMGLHINVISREMRDEEEEDLQVVLNVLSLMCLQHLSSPAKAA